MSGKQAVTGFRIVSYQVRRVKESERIRVVIEADVEDVRAGTATMGDVQGALLHHRVSDTEIGVSLFIDPKENFNEFIDG